jgi:hypothetical protein
VADATPPTVLAFDLNMATSQALIVFDEPVPASSLNLALLSVSGSLTITPAVVLTGTATNTNTTTVSISITDATMNELKVSETIAVSSATSNLVVGNNAVSDMAANRITATIVPSSTFTRDANGPQLLGYDVNMNDGTITLRFSETVNATSIDFEKIRIHGNGRATC